MNKFLFKYDFSLIMSQESSESAEPGMEIKLVWVRQG